MDLYLLIYGNSREIVPAYRFSEEDRQQTVNVLNNLGLDILFEKKILK